MIGSDRIIVPPMPSRVPAWSIYRTFDTADDKKIFIGVTSDKHWERFCEIFERPDLLADGSLATNNQRVDNRKRLHPELESMLVRMQSSDIIKRCEAANIPFAPIAVPEDLFNDPHLAAAGALVDVRLPDGRFTKLPKLPIYDREADYSLRMEAPEIGEHTRELLAELGYSDDEVRRFEEIESIKAFDTQETR